MNEVLFITSNQGDWLVEPDNGLVLAFYESREHVACPIDFAKIVRFDLQEWFRYWDTTKLASHADILDLGFWYFDDDGVMHYERPEDDFRQELRYQQRVGRESRGW